MEPCGAAHPAGQTWRQQAHGERARGGERADVHPQHRLPVAGYPQGPDAALDHLHDTLYVKCREQAARDASPTVAIIDSQSVKSAEKGGPRSTRRATMRVKGSRARSVTFSSTRKAC